MKRRDFIQKSTAATVLAGVGGLSLQSFSPSKTKKITILHTNDVHSHIDPFGPEDGRNANKGGVARRATLVETIRRDNPNTLLFLLLFLMSKLQLYTYLKSVGCERPKKRIILLKTVNY